MALIDDITSRLEPQLLKELTNRRDGTAQTVNTTLLQDVCDDVQGLIEIEMGVDYGSVSLEDRDIKFQKTMAVQGVLILFEMYTSTEGSKTQGRYDRWIDSLRSRRARKGITPDTNAKAAVTDDLATDIPAFDRSYMEKNFTPHVRGQSTPQVG